MRYSLTLFLIALLVSGSVGVLNYLADPYLLFSFSTSDSERLSRIDQFNHMRVTKPWYMREVAANAVIVGSSRSARLRPDHPAWSGEKGYNMAAPGMTIEENFRFIQHAHAIRPLSKLMIGLDYEAFIRPVPLTREGFSQDRMARAKPDLHSFTNRSQYVKDIASSLFSTPALSLSVRALTGKTPPGRRYFMDGTWEITDTFLTGRAGYAYIGKNVVLAHENNRLSPSENIGILSQILRFAHENNIETRLFFTPTHVFFVDLWFRLGYESMWLDFHRDIVAVNESVASELGAEPFPLWGFSDLSGFVNEPIYRKKDAHKGWYDDGVHTRVSFAREMMDAVWGESSDKGVALEPGNVEAYLARVLRMKDQFILKNASLSEALHTQVGLNQSIERQP